MDLTAAEKILEVIIRSPDCELEELVLECPGLTWNQVFAELDRMTRGGAVRLTAKGFGRYAISPTATIIGSSGLSGPQRNHTNEASHVTQNPVR